MGYKTYVGNFKPSEVEKIEAVKEKLEKIAVINEKISFRKLVIYLLNYYENSESTLIVNEQGGPSNTNRIPK